ncbi:MAG: IS1182 family transposase [Actinobacteria bacterium]|nr:IS1182 family transposase [Actinomycetota bacterium]
MQGKKEFKQRIYYDFNLESMVPQDHLLKRIEKLVPFEFVREKTKSYYSHTGKPSIDPVVLIKMLFIGYLFDIRSERKLVEEINLNLAYRWYIGHDLDEAIPDHSIFSKARTRFGKKLFLQIFEEILKIAISFNLISKDILLIDSTIVKANASIDSIVEVNLSPEEYWRELDQSEKIKSPRGAKPKEDISQQVGSHFNGNPDKRKMGKRRRARNAGYLKKRSTTDPDATMFYRPGQGGALSYKAHITTETNGFITAIATSPSSLHDTGAVPDLLEMHEKVLGTPPWIAADTKYGSEECLAHMQNKGIKTVILPEVKNNRPGYFTKDKFSYDTQNDCYICPNKKILKRKTKSYTLNRIIYSAKKQDCLSCNLRNLCMATEVTNPRKVTHYDSNYYSKAREWYYSNNGRLLQKLRRVVIEGVIGNAKAYHGLQRAKFRGKEKVQMQFLLTATALNLKKMVKLFKVKGLNCSINSILLIINFIQNIFWNKFGIPIIQRA